MERLDLKKLHKDLYSARKDRPGLVEVPPLAFLMIDGAGDPNTSQEYRDAIEALYGVAYTLKFGVKYGKLTGAPATDFPVMPLEGLWWNAADELDPSDKSAWSWTAMILVPDLVDDALVAAAAEQVREKNDPAALPKLRLETYDEGLSAQVMHIGPWSEELPTIERLHAFIDESGHRRRGKHHEIYLSDPRRTAPEKLKTIVRQPVAPA